MEYMGLFSNRAPIFCTSNRCCSRTCHEKINQRWCRLYATYRSIRFRAPSLHADLLRTYQMGNRIIKIIPIKTIFRCIEKRVMRGMVVGMRDTKKTEESFARAHLTSQWACILWSSNNRTLLKKHFHLPRNVRRYDGYNVWNTTESNFRAHS